MLDYTEVKRYQAVLQLEDLQGTGRVESAHYKTMKMVYLKGIEDATELCNHGGVSNEEAMRRIIGIIDGK